MVLTQECVLSLLIAEGGKIKKSDLVGKFKSSIDCDDPAEKEQNKELFKTFVNNVASVKEINGVRYVVVRKIYQNLLDGAQTAESRVEEPDNTQILAGEQRSEETGGSGDAGWDRPAVPEPDPEPDPEHSGESGENPTHLLSPIELALQKSKYKAVKVKRMMSFEIQRQGAQAGDYGARRGGLNEPTVAKAKPYGLPLRGPPSATQVEIRKLKVDPVDPPGSPKLDYFGSRRRLPSVETSTAGSPQLRRSAKSNKEPEELKDTRTPSLVPLEHSEHEWLVKCAAGLWDQVYGLLLRDNQLAEKRDFMSGFTALHWAAKCGNSKMLVTIFDLSRKGGVGVDVNAKTHGGYTPLHIAALHDQEYIMAMLVKELGADPRVRDNCGKRAYHYLHKGISETVREMLGKPKAQEPQHQAQPDKEELDLFPDLPKGLHSISRLFQPHMTGHKKKHKQRPAFYSLGDEPSEDREDSSFRQRLASDALK